MTQGPLAGIRIVDFSWVVAGPMTTKMLGALGAEVIKIETSTRPEFATRSAWFAAINNSKKSCTVDITTQMGQQLLRRLVGVSDVVVENFSARVLKKYGLGYDDLRSSAPGLIYVAASGVGRSGPQRDALAYGTLLQAYSGRAALVGEVNTRLEAMGIVPAWTDPATAMWEVLSILSAVYHKWRTGEGAYVDLSMLESTVALLPEALLRAGLGVEGRSPGGNNETDTAPSGCFHCAGKDDWLALSVRGDDEWQRLCKVMGRADLANDPRFADRAGRIAQKSILDGEVAEWLLTQSGEDAERILNEAGIDAARSRNIIDQIEDPHLRKRGLFTTMENRGKAITLPWMEEGGWRGEIRPAPDLGADNDYVFGELLGLKGAEIEALKTEGVIR